MQKHPNLQVLLLVKVATAQQNHLQSQTFCKFYRQVLSGLWWKTVTGKRKRQVKLQMSSPFA